MLRDLRNWFLDNLALSISLAIYIIVQFLSIFVSIPPDVTQQYIPLFFASILITIAANSHKQNKQIKELKDCLKLDKVEFIDHTSSFFQKLISLINDKSSIDVFYVSRNPLTSFEHPSVNRYREKIEKLIKTHSEEFLMRRLFLINNSKHIAESICKLFEKYKDSYGYVMKVMETDLDFAFTGYVIVDKCYCFIILPRSPDSDLRSVFIHSEIISAAFLERYNELWKSSILVNEEYCESLKSKYSL